MQCLIGVVNWYRPFIPELSLRMHNITEASKVKVIKPKQEDYSTIKEITKEIKEKTVLKFPDFSKNFFRLRCI